MSINIGINNVAKNAKNAYIGIDGKARQLVAAYVGDANGKARLVWQINKDKLTSYKGKTVIGSVQPDTSVLEVLGVQRVTDNKLIVCTMDRYSTNLKALWVYVIDLNNDGTIYRTQKCRIEEQDVDYVSVGFFMVSKTMNNNYGIIAFDYYNPYTGAGTDYLGCFDINTLAGWTGRGLNYQEYKSSIELGNNVNFISYKGSAYGGRIVSFSSNDVSIDEDYYDLTTLDSGKTYATNGTGIYIKLSNNRIAYVSGAKDTSSNSVQYTAVSIWSYDVYYRFTRIKTTYLPVCNIQNVVDVGNDRFIIVGNSQTIGFTIDGASNVTYKTICSHSISDVKNVIRIGTTNSAVVFGSSTMGIVHFDPITANTTFSYYGNIPGNTIYGMSYKEYETLMVNVNASGQLELSKYTYS